MTASPDSADGAGAACAAPTLIHGGLALVGEGGRLRVERRDIVVAGGRITSVAPSVEANDSWSRVDARDRLVVPGLINAHSHSPLHLLKGTTDGMDHVEFMWANQGDTAGRSAEELYLGAVLGALEMLSSGVTAVIDHYPEQAFGLGDVEPVIRAYQDTGMRAVVALRVFDLPYEDIGAGEGSAGGGAGSSLRARPMSESLDICRQAIARWHRPRQRVSVFPGPSNPLRCSDGMLVACHGMAVDHGLGVHTHLLETRVQRELAHRRHGRSQVAHLEELGILDERWSFAHGVWVDESDMELLGASRAVVVHNPESNAKLGVGTAPVSRMLARGVPLALGTDGSSTNDNQNLHEAMALAAWLPRIEGRPRSEWIPARQVLDMATGGGAAAFRQPGRLGCIAPGNPADLVLYDLEGFALVPPNDLIQQLVFSERGASVRSVWVAGTPVYDDGRFAFGDAHQIRREARRWFRVKEGEVDRNS